MKEPIRVLIVNYKMQCAGIESFIMNVYRNIDKEKVQFDFLVHYSELQFYDKEIEELGGNIYRLSVREDNNIIKYFRDLKRFFANHPEYQIVHGHMESFGVFYLHAAMKAGIRTRIAHSHIAERNRGIKGCVKHLLNCFYHTYATDLFACSDVAGKFMFGKSKYTVFNNAIDTRKFSYSKDIRGQIRSDLEIKNSTTVIGHVGRFNTQKNHIFLMEVFNEVLKINNDSIMLLLGEGDLFEDVVTYSKHLGINEKVRFLGIRADAYRIYQAIDIFVMPSLFEGLPVSGIEAQAAGLPCIFSDTITEQTKITPNVTFLNLSDSKQMWAEKISNIVQSTNRINTSKLICDAGYDISTEVKKLQEFYLSRVR